MAEVTLITGAPGNGKSSIAVLRAAEIYASEGRKVAANFAIDFGPLCVQKNSHLARAVVHVIPDSPCRADLDSLGLGGVSEEKAGLLILDECGGFFNARSWGDKQREPLMDWLRQSRKRFWDVVLIAQGPGMLDKQIRDGVVGAHAPVKRTDRKKTLGVRWPRFHVAHVRYGFQQGAMSLEWWIHRAREVWRCYSSYGLFGNGKYPYTCLPATQTLYARRGEVVWRNVVVDALLVPMFVVLYLGMLAGLYRRRAVFAGRRVEPERYRTGGIPANDLGYARLKVCPIVV